MAETTQPREQARRSRATDTAELDAAAALVQLTRLVQSIYSRIAVRHDLTPVQAKLLCIVADNPRGMGDLAQCFGVEKAALTGLVDRVERRVSPLAHPYSATGAPCRWRRPRPADAKRPTSTPK